MLKLLFVVSFVVIFDFRAIGLMPKIAIVGGGIGGTSCSYFLKQLFRNEVNITLFEEKSIGGRVNLLEVDGFNYESGASVIHPRNKYMMDFIKTLDLEKKSTNSQTAGIFDGKDFVYRDSSSKFISDIKLFWRYGFSLIKIWRQLNSMLDDFDKIYKLQEQEYAYTSVESLLDAMSPKFPNMIQVSIESFLKEKGIKKKLRKELAQSAMMVNYGQNNSISGFAGFVSLVGADRSVCSVKNGNRFVPQGLLQRSEATVIKARVDGVNLLPDGSYTLKYTIGQESFIKEFDIVILATPFIEGQKSKINFNGFRTNFERFQKPFQRTIATFVVGNLNPKYFGVETVPDDIVTFREDLSFNSLGRVTPAIGSNAKTSVYKIFSRELLSQAFIFNVFNNVTEIDVKDWAAYPHYRQPEELPPFFLHSGLYYINAIELAASAMEMSAIGAKNVALLAYNLWKNYPEKVNVHWKVTHEEL